MSGLFLNFYQVEIPTKTVQIKSVEYNYYNAKETFSHLKDNFKNLSFYRYDDKILFWEKSNKSEIPENTSLVNVDLNSNVKILSKILEVSIIDFIESKGYQIFKNKHSNSWEITSPKDILNGSIQGLSVNRIVHFSPCFFFKENKMLLGFSLSTSLKNSFTWNKIEFEKNGIDIKGLKGNEERIFANRQSLKRFLETTGALDKYDKIIFEENKNNIIFKIIDKFYLWLKKKKN